jgi:hypothetical protein
MQVTVNKGKVLFSKEDSTWKYIKGTTKWGHILEPNQFDAFSIDLYGEDVEALAEELENLTDEAYQAVEEVGKKIAGKADIFKVDEETGKKYLQFKLNAEYDGKPNKIDIYDVTGKKVTDEWDKLIGNGSTVKVKVQFKPYYMSSSKMVGLSKKFYALQVLDLVEYGGADSGFGDETDGDVPFDTNTSEEF